MSHHEGHQLTLADVDGDAECQAKTIKCFGFFNQVSSILV
jgi:hypothetical protein